MHYYILILVAVFSLKSSALVPLKNGSIVDNYSFTNKAGPSSLAEVDDIPEYLVKMYEASRNENSRSPPMVDAIIGQATSEHNTILFNLSVFDIGTDERIVSAKIRALVKTTVRDSPLFQCGRLVLYDRLSRTPIYSKAFQGSGNRWYVFPARALVKRWILSQHLSHGVYFRAESSIPSANMSLSVAVNLKAPRNKRPLLIVETDNSKTQEIKDIISLMSETKKPKRTSRRTRSAVVRDEGPCSIRPMTVHVRKHLNLNDVLLPRTIKSFRCGGKCTYPLDKSVNPTGHAVMKTILHSSGQDQGAGEPCCVPVKLKDIIVFVEKSPNQITSRSFQGMVVEKCGCR